MNLCCSSDAKIQKMDEAGKVENPPSKMEDAVEGEWFSVPN